LIGQHPVLGVPKWRGTCRYNFITSSMLSFILELCNTGNKIVREQIVLRC
jgi:hypothetical protein